MDWVTDFDPQDMVEEARVGDSHFFPYEQDWYVNKNESVKNFDANYN